MALTDWQRALVTAILEHGDPLAKWGEPWDVDRGNDLMMGGYPLKVTGERWDRRNAGLLRTKAGNVGFDFPTWLTVGECAALGVRPGPPSRQVQVETRGHRTHVCNVTDIRGLPEHFYRTFWEIHPVNPDDRHPGFERYARSLDVKIRHEVERATGLTRSLHNGIINVIHFPPFELFYSAHDYYHALAHELMHWATANTDLVETILWDPASDYARHELVSEFGATFLVADKGVADMPHPRSAAYVRTWRDRGSLTTAEVLHAAEDAARVATWLSRDAPAWRIIAGAARPPPSESSGDPHHSRSPPRGRPTAPAPGAAAAARRFVSDAMALEEAGIEKDPDAWEREAARLLEVAAAIDLSVPGVTKAVEAAVVLATSFDAPLMTADAWIRDFQDRTGRRRAMRETTKGAADQEVRRPRGPRIT